MSKTPSPKIIKKNYLKVNPNHGHTKK